MNWKRSAVFGVALTSVLATAGIGYGVTRGEGGSPVSRGTSGWPARLAVASPYPRPGIISEFQWAIVEDGWVDDIEMQAAVDATIACAAKAGVTVSVPGPARDAAESINGTLMTVTHDPGRPAAVTACKWEFRDAASMLYGAQFATWRWAAPEEHDRLFNECLRGEGFEADGPMTVERLAALTSTASGHAAFKHCGESGGTVPLHPVPEGEAGFGRIEGCLAAHGYVIPPIAERTEPFWTPERLNEVRSLPELLPVWRKCELVGRVTALAETR